MSVILALSLTFTRFSSLVPETFLVSLLCWVWMTVDKSASCTYTRCCLNSSKAFHGKSTEWHCSFSADIQNVSSKSLLDPSEECYKQGKSPPLCGLQRPGRPSNTLLILHKSFCEWSGELVTLLVQKATLANKPILKSGSTVRSRLSWIIPPLDNLKQNFWDQI